MHRALWPTEPGQAFPEDTQADSAVAWLQDEGRGSGVHLGTQSRAPRSHFWG